MQPIAAEVLVRRLIAWGVDTIYGLPGDGINGLFEGLRRHQDEIEFVLVHHEEAAAFMACAHAKTTGRLGVCISGPGGVHLLNGLYDAKLDHQPVLAITGMQETSLLGTGYQQEVHLEKLYQDVADYDVMITNPTQVETIVDLAIRHALARRTVSHITFPNDIQIAPADQDPYERVAPARPPSTAPVFLPAPGRPREDDLRRLADALNSGEKIAILAGAGAGALHARDELLQLAEVLGAPIVKTLPGKAAVRDDSPYTTGGIGLLGTRPSEELMTQVDTLFMVGTNFPYTKHLPEPSKVTTVQLEVDPILAGSRMPTSVSGGRRREGGPAGAAAAAAPQGRPELPHVGAGRHGALARGDGLPAERGAGPDRAGVPHVRDRRSGEQRRDPHLRLGTIATWAARHWTIRDRRQFYLSGNLATMAPGLPYAIAAQHAHPGRQVIGFVGDGGFAMLMAEFLTAVRHELPIKIDLHQQQRRVRANPVGADGPRLPGVRRTAPHLRRLRPPALVDVNVNADEPPMPGKIATRRRRGSRKRSCAASRTGSTSSRRSWRTRSRS